MYVWLKHQRKQFNIACQEHKKKARIMCDKLGCCAVYYGYADYSKSNLRHYELFLKPLDEKQYNQLDTETRKKFPNRALFFVFER